MRETPKARTAWADYLALGPGRSLEKLLHQYQSGTGSAPTMQLTRLKSWSSAFGWQARLDAIADEQAKAAEAKEAEYRHSILEDGYALVHKRVEGLKALGNTLYAELTVQGAESRRWLRDVKQIGGGRYAERVEIERFNSAEYDTLLAIWDAIAKELGQRQQKHELTIIAEQYAAEHGLDPVKVIDFAKRLAERVG